MIQDTVKDRNYNIDLIKTVGLFLVPAIHSLLNLNYYSIVLSFSPFPFLFTVLRQVFICCVPLFLLSTGYLNCYKQIKTNKVWVIKLLKILIPYIIISFLLSLYYLIRYEDFNPIGLLTDTDKYTYSWYVKMYIGLYLLMPFINVAYNKLETKKNKIIMIGVMILLSNVPSLLKYGENSFAIDYWFFIYPITYYLLGGFIKEYGIPAKRFLLLLIMPCSVLCNTAICIFTTNGRVFEWTNQVGYSGFFVLITSVCLFCLLLKIDLSKSGKTIKKVLVVISASTLPAYLISKIFDDIVYGYVISISSANFKSNFYYIPLTVIVVFTASVLCGIPIQKFSTFLTEKALENKDKLVIKR